jgi:hypothetical protein
MCKCLCELSKSKRGHLSRVLFEYVQATAKVGKGKLA